MNYKQEFIRFMAECGVLTFGDFTAKSGRKTPYFVNTGNYRRGAQIARLGEFYADCIRDSGLMDKTDVLFGPAYKGIPLAVSAAIACSRKYGRDFGYCFNRKEEKDHGEGGSLVGSKLKDGDRVLIVEDVITAGTAMRETIPILTKAADGIILSGAVISVDRMERGTGDLSAVQEVRQSFGLNVCPIITVLDIIDCIEQGIIAGKEYLEKMREYRKTYGV